MHAHDFIEISSFPKHLGVDGVDDDVMKTTILRSRQIVKSMLAKFQKLSGIRVYCSATGPTERYDNEKQ